jgi:(p)ppGpp synthase/HD superfamily hydrolase
MNVLDEKIDRAIEFATKAHNGQFRKTDLSVPYIYHPISVGVILLRAGFSEEVVIAGILHDVIEDCGVTAEEVLSIFGSSVTNMILAVSEDKRDSWEKRKADYLEKIISSSSDIKAISAADKLHNIHSMIKLIRNGGNIDNLFKRDKKTTIEHYVKYVEVLSKSWSSPLVDELVGAVGELEDLI